MLNEMLHACHVCRELSTHSTHSTHSADCLTSLTSTPHSSPAPHSLLFLQLSRSGFRPFQPATVVTIQHHLCSLIIMFEAFTKASVWLGEKTGVEGAMGVSGWLLGSFFLVPSAPHGRPSNQVRFLYHGRLILDNCFMICLS